MRRPGTLRGCLLSRLQRSLTLPREHIECCAWVGIKAVIVNGTLIVEDDEHTGALPGRVLSPTT